MEKEVTGGGISFCGVLTIIFIVLKLLHKISWSWFWVLSPIWIPLSVSFIFAILYIIISVIHKYIE